MKKKIILIAFVLATTAHAAPPTPQQIVKQLENPPPTKKMTLPKDLATILIRQLIQKGYEKPDFNPPDPSSCFSAYEEDLNKDGNAEWLISCGGDQDCLICKAHNGPVWVYRQAGNKPERIMTGSAGYLVGLAPLKTVTQGYRDLVTREHASAAEGEWILYQFDGKRYRATQCFLEKIHLDPQQKEVSIFKRHPC